MANQTSSMYIYTITHRESGKCYVGQTRADLQTRWRKHFAPKAGHRSAIKCALLKYGREAFDFAAIDIAETQEQLNHKESFWIRQLNSLSPNGYNLTSGGESPESSPETLEKLSASLKKRFAEKPWGNEGRAKGWAVMRAGFKHTAESKQKIADSKKRAVIRSDGEVFDSIEAAAASVGRNKVSLWRVLQGNLGRHTCGGFGWKYRES